MIQILHNPRCTKSREVFNYLAEKGVEAEEIRYIDNPLSAEELREIANKIGIKPIDWVRKTEALYKSELKGKTLSDDQWFEILSQNPRLIERPVVINGDKAVIGRPFDKIFDIL